MRAQAQIIFDTHSLEDASRVAAALIAVLKENGIAARVANVGEASDSEDVLTIYTDGGCDLKKDGIGAWAFRIEKDGVMLAEESECWLNTTNNRMELLAVIRALEDTEIGPKIKLFSGSEYVIKGITQWCRNWVRNGWVTRNGQPVVNKDLWQRLIDLYQLHNVTFTHVKGHSGNPGNERVDTLCTEAMQAGFKMVLAGETATIPIDTIDPSRVAA